MTGQYVIDLVNEARRFSGWNRCPVDFDETVELGMGFFHNSGPYDQKLKVGIMECARNPSRQFSIADSVTPVVDLYHEMGHAVHFYDLFEEKSQLAKVIAFSNCACMCSQYYYTGCGYKTHPHEIAAEYLGIYGADKFLSHCFGRKKSLTMLNSYMQDHSVYFGRDAAFSSVEDALSDLNGQFADYALKHRPYQFERDAFLYRQSSFKVVPWTIVGSTMQGGSGMMQDYVEAVYALQYLDDDYSFRNRPVFEGIPMGPKSGMEWLVSRRQATRPKPKREELDLFATRMLLEKERQLRDAPDAETPEF